MHTPHHHSRCSTLFCCVRIPLPWARVTISTRRKGLWVICNGLYRVSQYCYRSPIYYVSFGSLIMKGMWVDKSGWTHLQSIRGNITQGIDVSSADGADCTGHRSGVVAAFWPWIDGFLHGVSVSNANGNLVVKNSYIEVVIDETTRRCENERIVFSAPRSLTREDLLRGVFGRRQVTPLCKMWYATRPDLNDHDFRLETSCKHHTRIESLGSLKLTIQSDEKHLVRAHYRHGKTGASSI